MNLDVEICLDYIEKAISCRKQMFKLAENKKAPTGFMITMILEKWFDLEAKRYRFAKVSKESVGKMEYFKGECEKLAKITHQMAKTIYGNDSKFTRDCKERYENFENWFKNVVV